MAEDQKGEVYRNENLEQDSSSDNEKSRTGNKQRNKGKKGTSEEATRRNTNTEGYGSSQKSDRGNVGPLDADLNELPSKRRTSGNNQTGPGLG